MKLLVFAPYYPPHIGGVEMYASALHRELRKRDVSITVFAPRLPAVSPETETGPDGDIRRYPAWEPVHNYPLPKYWPFFWTPGFWKAFRALKAERPDIVISHTRFFASSLLALFYARSRHIPLLHIEHGSSFVRSGGPIISLLAKFYDHTLGRLVLTKAGRVVAVSEGARVFVSRFRPDQDIPVIYRGFDVAAIDSINESTALKKDANVVRIMTIGRLVSGKGYDVLLEALGKLRCESQWECIFIGDGPERKKLEKQAGLFSQGRIRFLGERKWEEALALLKTADIFVNPSLTEGLPTTVAEAMLCGKAVIATNVGGTHELFLPELQSSLLSPGDSPSLTTALSHLISDPDARQSIGGLSGQSVASRFSWDEASRKFLAIFSEMTRL